MNSPSIAKARRGRQRWLRRRSRDSSKPGGERRRILANGAARFESSVAFLLPDVPVLLDGLEHGFGGVVQPFAFLFGDMVKNEFAGGRAAEMDVGSFPSHGVQKAEFGIGGAQGGEFDAGAVGGKTANDPASTQLHERIGTAHGPVDDGLVEDFGGAFIFSGALLSLDGLRPVRGRRDQSLSFAGDAASVPVGNRHVAGVAEAAQSSSSVGNAKRNSGGLH